MSKYKVLSVLFQILGAAFLCVCLYLVLCEVLDLPSRKSHKGMQKAVQLDGAKHDDDLDLYIESQAKRLSEVTKKFLILSPERHSAIENALSITRSRMTPDVYCAKLILFFFAYMLIMSLLTLVIGKAWFLVIGVAVSALFVYLDYNKLMNAVEKRRKNIEAECASFASYLASCISAGMIHIPSLFNSYRKSANSRDFADELTRTVADMETSSVDRALQRMDARVNSPYMTKIVRGLLQQLVGNNQKEYFREVAYQMNLDRAAKMERIAIVRKERTAIFNIVIYGGIIAVILVAVGVDLLNSLGGAF